MTVFIHCDIDDSSIELIPYHLMERKVIVKEELASPRVDPLDEEDVFDYPGLEDVSSGTGPVPRDAHIALKEGIMFRGY